MKTPVHPVRLHLYNLVTLTIFPKLSSMNLSHNSLGPEINNRHLALPNTFPTVYESPILKKRRGFPTPPLRIWTEKSPITDGVEGHVLHTPPRNLHSISQGNLEVKSTSTTPPRKSEMTEAEYPDSA